MNIIQIYKPNVAKQWGRGRGNINKVAKTATIAVWENDCALINGQQYTLKSGATYSATWNQANNIFENLE